MIMLTYRMRCDFKECEEIHEYDWLIFRNGYDFEYGKYEVPATWTKINNPLISAGIYCHKHKIELKIT